MNRPTQLGKSYQSEQVAKNVATMLREAGLPNALNATTALHFSFLYLAAIFCGVSPSGCDVSWLPWYSALCTFAVEPLQCYGSAIRGADKMT